MTENYLPYLGNKFKFIKEILTLTNYFDYDLVEPFGGSGIVSRSFCESGKNSILNELDVNIYKIHESFKYGTYSDLVDILDEIWSYGNSRDIKEDYYSARTALNAKYFGNTTTGFKQGFYLWAISTFCINSMLRFGPNGPNQGFGNRGVDKTKVTESYFNSIQMSYANIELRNQDYRQIISEDLSKKILFLDPPYVEKDSGTYKFNEDLSNEFLDNIKTISTPVIYTDILSDKILNILSSSWNYKILRDNIGIGKVGKTKNYASEVIYWNFKTKTSQSLF